MSGQMSLAKNISYSNPNLILFQMIIFAPGYGPESDHKHKYKLVLKQKCEIKECDIFENLYLILYKLSNYDQQVDISNVQRMK